MMLVSCLPGHSPCLAWTWRSGGALDIVEAPSGPQGCPAQPKPLNDGAGLGGAVSRARNGVVGGQEQEAESLTYSRPWAPTSLPAFPCAAIESKRCWNREGRGWPWGGRVGALSGEHFPA